jgi:chromosome segregation ATPase
MTRTITDYDAHIADLQQQLSSVHQTIATIARNPIIRAQTFQELEQRLPKMQQSHALVVEQSDMYKGSALEQTMARELANSEQKLKDFQTTIEATRLNHQELDSADKKERRKLQHVEQELLRGIQDLKGHLQEVEQKRNELHKVKGEQTYFDVMLRYRNLTDMIEDKERAQEQIVEHLAQWPDLQQRFLEETSVPDPSDGPSRIAQAALGYLDALIAESTTLQGVTLFDGTPLCQVLALTDQEVLAQSYQGGLDLLQKKRALLQRFIRA